MNIDAFYFSVENKLFVEYYRNISLLNVFRHCQPLERELFRRNENKVLKKATAV